MAINMEKETKANREGGISGNVTMPIGKYNELMGKKGKALDSDPYVAEALKQLGLDETERLYRAAINSATKERDGIDGIINEYKGKAANGKDPVAKALKYHNAKINDEELLKIVETLENTGWENINKSYGETIESIGEAIEAANEDYKTRKGVIEAYFKEEIASYKGDHDTMSPVREAAIDTVAGAGKAVEKLARRGAGIPFTFLNMYTGGAFPEAKEIISVEPNYVDGLSKLAKQRIAWSIKDQAAAAESRLKREEVEALADLELEYKDTVKNLENVRNDIAGRLANYITVRRAQIGIDREYNAERLAEYLAEKGKAPAEAVEPAPAAVRKPTILGEPSPETEEGEISKHDYISEEDVRLTPEEMAEIEKYAVSEKDVKNWDISKLPHIKKKIKEWDMNDLPHYKSKNGTYVRDDIDALADNLVDSVLGKREK
jgi:hypothetical protein